jgi:response regulator RpfG family c-di-GMP phosphodiesterase
MTCVLLVDGYDESRDAMASHLREVGYEVVDVEEEDDAVETLRDTHVDIVLLDLPMAEAEEAANALREAAPPARVMTVIALVDPTNSRRMREVGHASGIDYFFLRPCPPAEIVKHLKRLRR